MNKHRSLDRPEKWLKHSLEMLSVLSDGIEEPIYVLDPDTYEILFVNKKSKELFGENITGKKCYKVFHKMNHPCPFCTNKHIFGENLGKAYVWQDHENKKNKRWYRGICKAIQWPGGKHVRYGIAIDVTAQRKIEEALRQSEEGYRDLVENAIEVIYSLSADGKIMSLNPAFEKITGWSSAEWVDKPFTSIIHPEDLNRAVETFEMALSGKTPPPYEMRVLSKSGEYLVGEFTSLPLMEDGKVVGEFGIVRDITERKRIEEALRQSEELFRSVVDNSHESILIIDDNFRIIYANNEAIRLSGYPNKVVAGQDFRKFLDESCKTIVEANYKQRLKGEKIPSQYEFKIVRKNGEKRDVEARTTVLRDKQGKTRIVAQLLDVTENKKIENERKRFDERLSALNVYGQRVSMAKSMNEIYKLTLNAAEETLGFEYASLLMVEGNMLCLTANRGYSKELTLQLPLDGDKGITTKVARKGKPIFVSDIRKEKTYVRGGRNILSELAVPIKIGKKVLGVLNIESQRLAAFNQEDKKLLEILASYAAIATGNLKRRRKLSALNEYGRSLNMVGNPKQLYSLTLNAMEKTLGFEFATFFVVEGQRLKLVAHRGYPKRLRVSMPLNGRMGISVKAAKRGKPVLIADISREKAYVAGRPGMLSELAVPIRSGGNVLGVLNVESERLGSFDEEDTQLLEILASHAAAAITNLERRKNLKIISQKIKNLMKNSTRIMQVKDLHERLEVIAKAVQRFGWRRVVISLRNENLEGIARVTAGLTEEENKLLAKRRAPGHVWKERLGPKFEKYKIGEFYYLPWSDPWIREHVHHVPPQTSLDKATTYAGVPSKLSPEEMVDWHPQDMLYAPLHTPEGRIVGTLSMDDPVDGRRPTKEVLAPLELFLHQATITIENTQLIEGLKEARKQLEDYAQLLEDKVEQRTVELRKSQEQLLRAQRFAVIGELAGMVGHDLRNPLTSIAGAEYYLRKRLNLKENGKIREMLTLIKKNIVYSNKIINDLLDYSREIELEIGISNPKALIREAMFVLEAPKNVQIENLTKNKPKMQVDVEKTKRVFANIVKNAIEAMSKGGTLTITSNKVKDNVEIVFADTGVGMSEETLQKLWTPLFTTKAKGMGFGLPICKRFIEAHGGSIAISSVAGKGTTITVTLPIEQKNVGGEKIWVKPLESSLLTTTKT
jgi:PAS domain S-box-containing protein